MNCFDSTKEELERIPTKIYNMNCLFYMGCGEWFVLNDQYTFTCVSDITYESIDLISIFATSCAYFFGFVLS